MTGVNDGVFDDTSRSITLRSRGVKIVLPEGGSVYKLSRRIDLFICIGSAVVSIVGITMLLHLGNDADDIRPFVGILGLSIASIFALMGCFLVNTIILTNDKIVFQPCGLEILLSDIDRVKNASEFRCEADANCPARIELIAKVKRLKWTPLSALWVGEAILIRTYGFSVSRFVE